eukprot:jgi/Botrbrau1/1920/Bobra.0005s0025.1
MAPEVSGQKPSLSLAAPSRKDSGATRKLTLQTGQNARVTRRPIQLLSGTRKRNPIPRGTRPGHPRRAGWTTPDSVHVCVAKCRPAYSAARIRVSPKYIGLHTSAFMPTIQNGAMARIHVMPSN